MEPNILPDPNNLAFMHPPEDHAHYANGNYNHMNHVNQEADNIANRLQEIPIPFHQVYQHQFFDQFNNDHAQYANNTNHANGQHNNNMRLTQPVYHPFQPHPPPVHLPQPQPVHFPQPQPVHLPQPVQLPQPNPHQQIPTIPLPGNPPQLLQQAQVELCDHCHNPPLQQNRPAQPMEAEMPHLVPYNLRPLSPEAQARPNMAAARQRAVQQNIRPPPVHRPRIIPLEANAPLNGAENNARNVRVGPIGLHNRVARNNNPVPPNNDLPIVPQGNGLIRRLDQPFIRPPRIDDVARIQPRRFLGPRRPNPRFRRTIDLERLPDEGAEAYRARNQYFNLSIMPKVRERDRVSKDFVRWMYPGVIGTAEGVLNRINELRGDKFDLVKFLDHHDLLGTNLPYEEELQERFPITHEDLLVELLAEQVEEYCREDPIYNPRARSPSPDPDRRENETGQQYFTRMFGDVAGKAGVSPAPGDVPENLEEALALLARVPNGQPPQRVEFDPVWYDRQLEKIRIVIQQEIEINANKRRRIRQKAAKEEVLQLSYEIATMEPERRKEMWKKAIRNRARRENIELRAEFGPDMPIPPRVVADEEVAADNAVIVLGDSDTEEPAEARVAERNSPLVKRCRFPKKVPAPGAPKARCKWPRTPEEVNDVLNGIVRLDSDSDDVVEEMDTQPPVFDHDPDAPGPSTR